MDNQQEIIDALTAEKNALDQSYVNEIRTVLELRKQHNLKDKYISDLNFQIQKCLEDKKALQDKIDELETNKEQIIE